VDIWAEGGSFSKVDVADFPLGTVGVPVEEDANDAGEAVGDGDLLRTEERDIYPSQLAGGEGGVDGDQVGGGGEEDAGKVLGMEFVRFLDSE
jgi:hypothetical protein